MASVDFPEQPTEAPEDKRQPFVKQLANVYTMMLIISFIALVIGCVLLYLEMQRYNFDYKPSVQNSPAGAPTVQTLVLQTWNETDSFPLLG